MTAQWKKTFAIIFSGQLFSILTSSMVQFAIVWHLTATTGSASVLMIAGLCGFLPQALLGPFIGVWLDRWNRKATMIVADSAIALFSLLLGAYFFWSEPSLWFVYLILLIRSAASAFHAPAFQAAIPLIAPEDQLTRVAGWHQTVFSASNVFGPALGIAVYSASSLGTVLFLDVAGALIANLMLAFAKIRQPKPEKTAAPSFLNEFRLGWRAFITVKPIVVVTIVTAVFGIAFFPLATLFPLMTLERFGLGGFDASLVEAAFSIGMIAGGALLSWLASTWRDTSYMSASLIAIGIACIGSGAAGPGAFAVFAAMSFLMGAAGPLFNGPYIALVQKSYDPDMLGRVFSFTTSVTLLVTPLGLAMAGPVSDRFGVHVWFLGCGAVTLLLGAFLFAYFRNRAESRQTAE